MPQPLHHFLEEYAAPVAAEEPQPVVSQPTVEAPPQHVPMAESKVERLRSLPEQLRDAYNRGFDDGRLEGIKEMEGRYEELVDGRVAEIRSTLSREALDEVVAEVRRSMEQAHCGISASTARVLKPILVDCATRKSIAQLAEKISGVLDPRSGISITVSGPGDLLDLFQIYVAELSGGEGSEWISQIKIVPGGTFDVRVSVNDTVVETTLGDWIADIESAISQ
ncbi:MAG: hypothetical protein AAF732_23435 [Pseudomonadota bacterium]